ncbi:MAG: FecR domain-containing protein [Cyclobacteriaceae bacterium]
MNSEYQSIEALASDETFINFCMETKAEDVGYWENWVTDNPQELEKVEAAKELVYLFSLRLPEDEYQEEKKKIIASINGEKSKIRKLPKTKEMTLWGYVGRIAAVLVIGVLIGLSVNVFDDSVDEVVISESIIKSNPAGQKSTVFLSDGTKIILNSKSSVEYKKDFETDIREVLLKGEAFFDVAKDANRPFVVKTGELSTTALGTSFNVMSYDDSDVIKVSLLTGKVKVEGKPTGNTRNQNILVPGEEVEYNKSTYLSTKSQYETNDFLAWTKGTLIFKDDNFDEIKGNLETWYGVEIIVQNDSQELESLYSGEFINQSLETVLKAIGYSKHFTYTIEDKKVTINFKN